MKPGEQLSFEVDQPSGAAPLVLLKRVGKGYTAELPSLSPGLHRVRAALNDTAIRRLVHSTAGKTERDPATTRNVCNPAFGKCRGELEHQGAMGEKPSWRLE